VFLGSGTSKQFGVPLTHGLLNGFLKAKPIPQNIRSQSRALLRKLRRYRIDDNLENLLTLVDARVDPNIIRSRVGPYIPEIADLKRIRHLKAHPQDKEIGSLLRDYVFRKCFVNEPEQIDKVQIFFLCFLDGIRDYFGLPRELGKRFPKLPIFTTNFDNAFEQFCRRHKVGLYDGYDYLASGGLQFNHILYDGKTYLDRFKIYKLHGTVRYVRSSDDIYDELTTLPSSGGITINGRPAFPDLVYSGSYQYSSNSPQLELLYMMKEKLRISNRIIVVGYSFNDPHVLTIFREILSSTENSLILCDPKAVSIISTKFGKLSGKCIAIPIPCEQLQPLRDFAKYNVPR
jgi:hypothetical protein